MKIFFFTIAFLVLVTIVSFAQTPVHYYTGFDNASEKTGWQEFRKGITTSYNWSYAGFGAVSAPNLLSHDYPVGSAATDTTVDWFVSPVFNFSMGGSIDSLKITVYGISGSATPIDYVGFYLLRGSNDPASASSMVELANLTGMISTSMAWRDTGNFSIPASSGNCYIGIKYRATQNWFVISIDNIHITGIVSTAGMSNLLENQSLSIFPNPANNRLQIMSGQAIERVEVFDVLGRKMIEKEFLSSGLLQNELDISSLLKGFYFIRMAAGNEEITKRFFVDR